MDRKHFEFGVNCGAEEIDRLNVDEAGAGRFQLDNRLTGICQQAMNVEDLLLIWFQLRE